MGKEFKDIDLVQPTKAAEPAVDFAVEEDVDTLLADTEYADIAIPQYKIEAFRKYSSGFTPAGRELGRPPQTKEQWEEWHRETIEVMESGIGFTFEEFETIIKSECKWLCLDTRQETGSLCNYW